MKTARTEPRTAQEMHPMTKAHEVALLDQMIAAFGPNSYLGPWLAENRASIVADIASDNPVDVILPSEAKRMAHDIIAEADARAKAIIDAAASAAGTVRHTIDEYERRLANESRVVLHTIDEYERRLAAATNRL
jgi:hypothetical protein